MAADDYFTTRATHRAAHLPDETVKWTDLGDGFNVECPPCNKRKELEHKETITLGDHKLIEEYYSTKLKRFVVVKSFDLNGVNDAHEGDWKEEAKHLRHLRHHHIVRILGSFSHQHFSSIILEPVAPCNLKTYLWRDVRDLKVIEEMEKVYGMDTSHLPRIMGCLAHALSYIHREEKVRHCDIKPDNILLEGPRAFFADFGLSKASTDSRSGSSGASYKTKMYTSPERIAEVHRNKSEDIFSLACVFAEIYTVSKGRTCKDFLAYREQKDLEEKHGHYHRVIEAVIEWLLLLSKTNPKRSDVQILRLLTAMFSTQPEERPSADEVWRTLTCCTTKDEAKFYCGPCCMPILKSEIPLSEDQSSELSRAKYSLSEAFKGDTVTIDENSTEKPFFKTEVLPDKRVGLDWVRNVRHRPKAVFDIVIPQKVGHHLIRKRSISDGDDVQWALACNEAQILQNVQHRHMISLFRTYRQGNVLTILYQPACKYDLRSYLELAEVSLQDRGFLVRSFGCLANALAKLHKSGFDHGDIRLENILVHVEDKSLRILLTKFSFGQKIENGNTWGRLTSLKDFIHVWSPDRGSTRVSEMFDNDSTAECHPPDWRPTETGQPAADVFSLGCVFIEMHTVLCHKKMRDFRKSRTDSQGAAYKYNLKAIHTWLDGLEAGKDYPTKDTFLIIVKQMIDADPGRRPTAAEVGRILQDCSEAGGKKRAGDCFVEPNVI